MNARRRLDGQIGTAESCVPGGHELDPSVGESPDIARAAPHRTDEREAVRRRLLPNHLNLLHDSGIADDVIDARGYRSLTRSFREDTRRTLKGCGFSGKLTGFVHMARPYADPVEILTDPTPARSPFIPVEARIVVGAVAPASPESIPIVLLPGFEYRMSEWRHPGTHEAHWRLERRKAAQNGNDE